MRHALANARYAIEDGYATLIVEVDGREAHLIWDQQKHILAAAGWIYFGSEFAETCPRAVIPSPYGAGPDVELDGGWTDDPRVAALFVRFLEDCNSPDFRPGPVPIPDG